MLQGPAQFGKLKRSKSIEPSLKQLQELMDRFSKDKKPKVAAPQTSLNLSAPLMKAIARKYSNF